MTDFDRASLDRILPSALGSAGLGRRDEPFGARQGVVAGPSSHSLQ